MEGMEICKLFSIHPPLYFYRIPHYFSPVQLFHNDPGDESELWLGGGSPGAKLVWWL